MFFDLVEIKSYKKDISKIKEYFNKFCVDDLHIEVEELLRIRFVYNKEQYNITEYKNNLSLTICKI